MSRRPSASRKSGALARVVPAAAPAPARDPIAAIFGIGEADDGRRAAESPLLQAFLFFERWCAVECPRPASMGDGWPVPILRLVFCAHALDRAGRVLFDELRWFAPLVGPVPDYDLARLFARLSGLLPCERYVFEFVYGATRTWLRAHEGRGLEHRRVKERCPFCMSFLPQGPVR